MYRQTCRTESVVERGAEEHAHENFRCAEGELDLCDQCVEDDAERHHADDRLAVDLAELQGAKEREADSGDGTKQAGFRNRLADAVAEERHDELEHAHHDHRRHADLPRENRGVGLGHGRLRDDERGPEHGEGHSDRGWRVEPEGHRRDVVAAGALRQANGHDGVDDVAEHHAERGTGEHSRVDEFRGESEAVDENAGEHGEVHDVVEHQAEKGVDVSSRCPLV